MGLDAKRALALLGSAVAIGIAGDLLLRGRPAGVNVLLFVLLFVAALALVLRVSGARLHQGRRWMALPLVVFAALPALHDSPLLVTVNVLALAGAISLGALRRARPRPDDASVDEYVAGMLSAGAASFAGSIELLEREVPWPALTRAVKGQRAATIARGLGIGAPLLLVFGGLFLAADTVFRHYAQAILPTAVPQAWPHVLTAAGIAWLAGGLLRDLAADRDDTRLLPPDALVRRTPRIRLGAAEVAVALVAVDLLFLAFVAVQARYLFGGRAIVLSHEHLTYAQYARHGFFELLAVSALVVPVVLVANTVVRRPIVRALSAALILLELAVAASALQRMHVYVDQYGLTELRIYVTGVTVWIAVVLVWAVPTVLLGNGRRFAVGAVVAGFAATLALNAIDPDALIVRTNVARGNVDPAYLARLSDDAVPALVDRLPRLRRDDQRVVARALLARRPDRSVVSWNASRARAARILAANGPRLRFYARP